MCSRCYGTALSAAVVEADQASSPATPTEPPRHRLPGAMRCALRRVEAFAMQGLGDLRKTVTGPAQAINVGQQGGDIGELVVTRHWTP